MLDPFDEIPDALKAEPKRLDAGFAVTFSGEEATEHGDSPDTLEGGVRVESKRSKPWITTCA
jgi:hypothetical protein